MINSYNSAILFGALEFVQTIIFSNIMTEILFGNLDNIFVRHLPRIFREKSAENKNKILFGFGVRIQYL